MMVRNLLVLFLTVTFVTACAAQDDAGSYTAADDVVEVSADEAALTALLDGYAEHFNLGHADMVAEMYADDAITVFANGGVQLGREEIEAGLAESMGAFGVLALTRDELHLAGDNAVARGTWSSTTAVEGADDAEVSGHYMTWFMRIDGDWKIQVVASNYDSEQPPEAHMGAISENVDDVEDDVLDGLMTAYEEGWAAGDAAALAMLYTENAHASFASQSVVEGRAAIESVIVESVAGTLDIHAKGTMDLGDGWAVNGGWYEIMDDSGHNVGNYLLLARATEDGSHQIHWFVSNGRPAPEDTE